MTPSHDGPAEPTSRRVYREAATLFRENGYAGTTTRALAEQLGVNKASLYYHVSKKEDLLFTICLEALEQIDRNVQAAIKAAPDADAALAALVSTHLTTMLSEIDMHATMMLERRHLTGDRHRTIQDMQAAYGATVTTVVAAAQSEGSLRPHPSAEDTTLALLNMLNWTITWYQPGGRWTPEALTELLFGVFRDGAGRR